MRPNRIILIRHGESEGNVDKNQYQFVPDYALNLTSNGIDQARRAGGKIKEIVGAESISAYVSPYYRTRQTFQQLNIALESNIARMVEDPRIREQDWGHLRHPDDNEEIIQQRDQYSTFYYRIPDGESGADVFDRVSTFLETLYRDFNKPDYPQNTLIVTHGMTLRMFLMRWFHWTVEEFGQVYNPHNCQIVVMEKQSNDKYILTADLKRRS